MWMYAWAPVMSATHCVRVVETYCQQKWATEESLHERVVCGVLVIQKSRKLGILVPVNQLEFSILKFRHGAGGHVHSATQI